MKSILEALFRGKIDVMEMIPLKNRTYHFDRNKLVDTLTPEQEEIYDGLINSLMDQCAMDNQDCFVIGFKMAVRIILESIEDTMKGKLFEDEDLPPNR